MTEPSELTIGNLDVLSEEVRSDSGPAAATRAFNEALIAEFRANGGVIPGDFARPRFLLLTTTGAKSAKQRTTPLAYLAIDGRILIVASKGGAPSHPAWYFNLLANPEVTVERGTETYRATAVPLEGADRDEMFARISAKVAELRRLSAPDRPTHTRGRTHCDRLVTAAGSRPDDRAGQPRTTPRRGRP